MLKMKLLGKCFLVFVFFFSGSLLYVGLDLALILCYGKLLCTCAHCNPPFSVSDSIGPEGFFFVFFCFQV